MAMSIRFLFVFLALHPSIAAHLRTRGVWEFDLKPGWLPANDTLKPGFSYSLPLGSGCSKPPKLAQTIDHDKTPAILLKTDGWNGFCQLHWPLCPDAIANKDYNYYAKGVGLGWIHFNGLRDLEYCRLNGFVKPEFATIVNNFTALQAKGEELCKTKYGEYAEKAPLSAMEKGSAGNFWVDETSAWHQAGAQCALGDLSCDIAYCNYAFCEKSDGSYAMTEACEGWDKVHGMPAARIP
jgi:hypothetical protein